MPRDKADDVDFLQVGFNQVQRTLRSHAQLH